MYFTETPSLREIEKAMKMVPNFTPRGHGVVILCKHEFAEKSCIGDSQKEILARTVSRINNPLFQKRFQKYINESETIPVNFRNSKHSISFTDTIRKKNKKDYALMSALYLLTAEFALWQTAKRYVTDNSIDFKSMQPAGISENGYTLLCAAKDLYLGTDYLTISDLADTQLIPPRMFALICNATPRSRLPRDPNKKFHSAAENNFSPRRALDIGCTSYGITAIFFHSSFTLGSGCPPTL